VSKAKDLAWRLYHLPCDICECRKVQVANYAQRLLLLCIVDVNGILCCNSIDHAIRQCKGSHRPGRWSGWSEDIAIGRLR